MTYLLVAANILTYIVLTMKGGPSYENLLLFGAKENGLVAQGELGRLFLPMFLHAGLLHLAFNMYGLYQVGRYLEILTGPRRLFVVYLVAGFCGNLCSFAFSQALSVGASGSLFGILLCLYVIERYEQRIRQGEFSTKSTLGPLIIINGMLSFVIPNIDWANHLGGAVAGTLMGLGFVMRHRLNLRRLQAAKFLGIETRIAKTPFLERERLYYVLLVVFCIGLAATEVRVGMAERAFGTGVKRASENTVTKRSVEMLKQFSTIVESENSEINPDRLKHLAYTLHAKKDFAAAIRVYQVALELASQSLGSEEFLSNDSLQGMEASMHAAYQSLEPDSNDLAEAIDDSIKVSDDACAEGASLFRALGFYPLSAKLYECAYFQVPGSIDLAASTLESYWLADQRTDVVRFVNTVQALQTGEIRVTDLPSVIEPFRHDSRIPSGEPNHKRWSDPADLDDSEDGAQDDDSPLDPNAI